MGDHFNHHISNRGGFRGRGQFGARGRGNSPRGSSPHFRGRGAFRGTSPHFRGRGRGTHNGFLARAKDLNRFEGQFQKLDENLFDFIHKVNKRWSLSFDNEEEKELFIQNVFLETKGREIDIVCALENLHPLIDMLTYASSGVYMKQFMKAFETNFPMACCSINLSRVTECLMYNALRLLQSEDEDDTCETWMTNLTEYCCQNFSNLVNDFIGSQILIRLFRILSVNIENQGPFNYGSSLKSNASGNVNYAKFEVKVVPASFESLSKKFTDALLSNRDKFYDWVLQHNSGRFLQNCLFQLAISQPTVCQKIINFFFMIVKAIETARKNEEIDDDNLEVHNESNGVDEESKEEDVDDEKEDVDDESVEVDDEKEEVDDSEEVEDENEDDEDESDKKALNKDDADSDDEMVEHTETDDENVEEQNGKTTLKNVPEILVHPIGSFFTQVCIQLADEINSATVNDLLLPHSLPLIKHDVGHISIKEMIRYAKTKEIFKEILVALVSHFSEANKYLDILTWLSSSCVEKDFCQAEFVQELIKALAIPSDSERKDLLVFLILKMVPNYKFIEHPTKSIDAIQPFTHYGSRVIQNMLKFHNTDEIADSILAVSMSNFEVMALNLNSCFVISEFLSSQFVEQDKKDKLIEKIKELLPRLVMIKKSSKLLHFIWKSATLETRIILVTELSKLDLEVCVIGPKLEFNYGVRSFVNSREEWTAMQQQNSLKRKNFTDILNQFDNTKKQRNV